MFENVRNSFGRAIEELHLKSFSKLRTIQHSFVVLYLCLVRSLFNNFFLQICRLYRASKSNSYTKFLSLTAMRQRGKALKN